MVELRRRALRILFGIAVASAIPLAAPVLSKPAATLRLELTAHVGGLRLVNTGSATAAIDPTIAVEKKESAGWVAIVTEFHAVSQCNRRPRLVEIAPGATLGVIPWRGFSCSGQCNFTCRANVYYGPGTFRYIVTTEPDHRPLISPEFSLPRRPPD